ncbi:glutaredoxin family protein [Methanosphaerula palustris]|uniref:Glutaredoxin n=1 Tax=Methanosphaerula palustris (strain ATCC BAA-1556 / DSM 19958 / E1-9c) TaxID=521011 RepID=B8GKJ1_METPE|nr:glutaredoxin family protein [Methanosphaerula palustris]ACL15874.1 glutaredoxin [Methanosphaerula palustris E1-9c]
MQIEVVDGRDKGNVMLYALSTCGWCAKTKELLKSLGVKYSYLYVDKVGPDEQEQVVKEIERFNPHLSFPTLVIGNDHVIVGFREDEIRKELA